MEYYRRCKSSSSSARGSDKAEMAIPVEQIRQASSESILESIADGVFTVDRKWRITSFNHAAEEITCVPRRLAIGQRCSEVFHSSMCGVNCALQVTFTTRFPVINRAAYIVNAVGRRVPVSVSTSILHNRYHELVGGVVIFRDLSHVEKINGENESQGRVYEIITRSPAMRKVIDILPQVGASNTNVLILGETGTGKELLARAIHKLSNRALKPFIGLNCGALPDNLLESELFGYKAGAFTDAKKDKPGRFAIAEGGILFLDEIGEISKALQIKLLRVLQEKTYEPLGGTDTVKMDVRVLAATNGSLASLIREGRFRRDLYYRLNVVKLDLPPLRERREDIPLLVEHFIARFNRAQGKAVKGVNRETLAILMTHNFPGNIRELENIIERAFVLCSEGYITLAHLAADYRGHDCMVQAESAGMEMAVQAVEIQAIIESLQRNHFNRAAAARELGIHKSTLFRKIKQLGIALPQIDGRFRLLSAV